MERANKKGLLKKSRTTNGKAGGKKKTASVQPPHVARRLSVDKDKPGHKVLLPEAQIKVRKESKADDEDARFKF